MSTLIAIDLGLKSGLAIYGADGRLRSYRSTNFGSRSNLRSAVWKILKDAEPTFLIMEGDKNLGDIWSRAAQRMGVEVIRVAPKTWREVILLPRERRSGQDAKDAADGAARAVIEWSDAPKPTSLRHDAAEAILIGLWGIKEVGWIDDISEIFL